MTEGVRAKILITSPDLEGIASQHCTLVFFMVGAKCVQV